jgi:hypothetical protein
MNSIIRNTTAEAATLAYRIAKFGAADGGSLQADSSVAKLLGVYDELAHDSGERADVIRAGRGLVQYGGAVTRGDWLTSDANGKAVAVGSYGSVRKVVAGGSAGNITVSGVKTTDELVAVIRFDVAVDTGSSATGNKVQGVSDVTAEFSISAADTINNAAGTDTSGDTLLVIYRRKVQVIGRADVSGVDLDVVELIVAPAELS